MRDSVQLVPTVAPQQAASKVPQLQSGAGVVVQQAETIHHRYQTGPSVSHPDTVCEHLEQDATQGTVTVRPHLPQVTAVETFRNCAVTLQGRDKRNRVIQRHNTTRRVRDRGGPVHGKQLSCNHLDGVCDAPTKRIQCVGANMLRPISK